MAEVHSTWLSRMWRQARNHKRQIGMAPQMWPLARERRGQSYWLPRSRPYAHECEEEQGPAPVDTHQLILAKLTFFDGMLEIRWEPCACK